LVALLARLEVETVPSDMSFSVKAARPGRSALEWSGTSLATVFSQRRNLFSPRFWGMLKDILRFNRLATALAVRGDDAQLNQTVGDFLTANRLGAGFTDDYFLPMIACIWSCPTEQMLQFPMATMIRFCHNHGLLQVADRPQWYTVKGGSRQYVNKLVAQLPDARCATPIKALHREAGRVTLHWATGQEDFDGVVMACHPDQALALLGQGATTAEQGLLGAIRYQPNLAVLHTDVSVLPSQSQAWAAWNYERRAADAPSTSTSASATHSAAAGDQQQVCLHYLINRLQPLPWQQPVVVSLNPLTPIAPGCVIQTFHYDHPVFDAPAIAAQKEVATLQGQQQTWFCGAWCGYGFHEDGLQSGWTAARLIQERWDAPAGSVPIQAKV
jgi:uncharacterized protein